MNFYIFLPFQAVFFAVFCPILYLIFVGNSIFVQFRVFVHLEASTWTKMLNYKNFPLVDAPPISDKWRFSVKLLCDFWKSWKYFGGFLYDLLSDAVQSGIVAAIFVYLHFTRFKIVQLAAYRKLKFQLNLAIRSLWRKIWPNFDQEAHLPHHVVPLESLYALLD